MIELVPPPAEAPPTPPPARRGARPPLVRIKPTIRFPTFLAKNQQAVETIERRWGETAMHALVAAHAPGANLETHGLAVAEHGPLAWVDWVEWKRERESSERVASWFQLEDTWQCLPAETGLERLMKSAAPQCLEAVTSTLEAVRDATGLEPLVPGAFAGLVRSRPQLSPEQLGLLASLVRAPRVVGRRIEFTGRFREHVGLVCLDVPAAHARFESRLELG